MSITTVRVIQNANDISNIRGLTTKPTGLNIVGHLLSRSELSVILHDRLKILHVYSSVSMSGAVRDQFFEQLQDLRQLIKLELVRPKGFSQWERLLHRSNIHETLVKLKLSQIDVSARSFQYFAQSLMYNTCLNTLMLKGVKKQEQNTDVLTSITHGCKNLKIVLLLTGNMTGWHLLLFRNLSTRLSAFHGYFNQNSTTVVQWKLFAALIEKSGTLRAVKIPYTFEMNINIYHWCFNLIQGQYATLDY